MRRISFDARFLTTGVGTYTWNLLTRLKGSAEMHLSVLTLPEHAAKVAPFCDEVKIVNAGMYSAGEQWKVPAAAKGSDLHHATHYNAPLLYTGRLVVSIHDLNHILDENFRRTWKSRLYARPMFTLAAWKADHILTLSEYSKSQIIKHLGVSEEKVTVTYCGVGQHFFAAPSPTAQNLMRAECAMPGPYILFIGNLKPHKNVAGLLRAFALTTKGRSPSCRLLIIGDDPNSAPLLRRLAAELGIAQYVNFVPSVSSEVLHAAYWSAEMTILPSFEEGFGLPVLESMACGTPVACSAAASLPEVGGDAAEYFDPRSVESITGAIQRVNTQSDRRAEMRARGLEQARRFTWEACVDKIIRVYGNTLNN